MTPTERTSIGYEARHDASCEEVEDGLGIWRGITAALVIEAGAVGIVWAVWQAAPIVAAWWRAK